MPVQKFKTFEDAELALLNPYPDDAYFSRVAELWNFADKLNRVSYPRGVFKFRTLEDANRHREELELAHIRNKVESRRK